MGVAATDLETWNPQGGTSSGGSAAVGFAVISGPGKDEQVATGKPYTITWTPDATHMGNIAIYLLGGHDPSTLQMLRTISESTDRMTGSVEHPLFFHHSFDVGNSEKHFNIKSCRAINFIRIPDFNISAVDEFVKVLHLLIVANNLYCPDDKVRQLHDVHKHQSVHHPDNRRGNRLRNVRLERHIVL
ncbi:hypothetical protein P8C59_004583 [Phyllachora maydis]|uniref:Yeast cell wall synthesis Kre9/Knh1-like N-terminal domain-containing protein n=1 Tax=Phyllachora maydis TaxID=1825666 RepID=A0AAD9MAJ4_9PEZI|nr:hypothetical protein P8C59_004583 [Phyllachora maydis]